LPLVSKNLSIWPSRRRIASPNADDSREPSCGPKLAVPGLRWRFR